MNKIWKDLALAAVIAWGVPWLLLSGAQLVLPQEETPEFTQPQAQQTQPPGQEITVLRDGIPGKMALEDYLTGVLLAELPGSFHPEAKKAQAIVARTYTLRTVTLKAKHPGAICTDSTCCQAFLDPDAYSGSAQTLAQARSAVEETEALVLTYQGQLIDATYFSCSGGQTEDAVAVWGSDVPYLQSVDSPGEEAALRYMDTVEFTPEAFREALGVDLKGSPTGWFGAVTYTQGGGVDTMVIGGNIYGGTVLRSLLGLRSTAFTLEAGEDTIRVTTRGFGHRVGMSQYGAEAMARSGSQFPEILTHYYTGAEITGME